MSKQGSYWRRTLEQRISRRRALQAAALGAAGLTGAAAIGCEEEEEAVTEATATPIPGEELRPTPGGIGMGTMADLYNMDPHKPIAFLTHVFGSWIYSRLMRFASAYGELPEERWFEAVPELAQKVENPDPQTYIFTLNPEAKWHNVDPTFGRQVTAEDVVFSYNRYQELSPQAVNMAMVDSVTAGPDDLTVTFKLKHPFALFLKRIASPQDLWILPPELIEADGDAEKRAVGSGPFLFGHYNRSVDFEFLKNPDYFEKDEWGNRLPYYDRLRLVVIPDPNAVVSQFIAKKIYTFTCQPRLVPEVLSAVPDVRINRQLRDLTSFIYFQDSSYTKDEGPFNDVRVRRAVSMAIDRDGLLALVRAPIDDEGGEWPNIVPAGLAGGWWLDPKSPEMGEPAKWYKYDVAEAKKLMDAAGYGDGFDTRLHFSSTVYTNIIPYYPVVAEALPGLLREIGINVTLVPEDYIGQYMPETYTKGNFDGMAWGLLSVFNDALAYLSNSFLPFGEGGGRNMSKVRDEQLIADLEEANREPDVDELRKKLFDIQRYISDQMYYVPGINPIDYQLTHPFGAPGMNATGPAGTYGLGTELTMWGWLRPEHQNP
ncbi:MAG: ABC transporter substrate-binding protein [Dehalococcoidia bacterium]